MGGEKGFTDGESVESVNIVVLLLVTKVDWFDNRGTLKIFAEDESKVRPLQDMCPLTNKQKQNKVIPAFSH